METGFARLEEAVGREVGDEVRREFEAIYRPSALRLTDRRVWRLVGHQLLDWLTHVGQLAGQLAIARGADRIAPSDLRQAVREVGEISASPFCPPVPDEPDLLEPELYVN